MFVYGSKKVRNRGIFRAAVLLLAFVTAFMSMPFGAVPVRADTVTSTVAAGTNPLAVAVNPATNKIYVANYDNSNVTVITEQTVHSGLISTSVTPLDNDITSNTAPTFQLSAVSHYTPTAPAVRQISDEYGHQSGNGAGVVQSAGKVSKGSSDNAYYSRKTWIVVAKVSI